MRIESIIGLQKTTTDGRAARETSVHHAGAEEALSVLINLINDAANGDAS